MLKFFRRKRKEEYEFLPDALEIIESPNAPLGSLIIWLIFVLLILALVWSYLGKVDIVASARGKVIPNGNVKVVQPFEEGIITGIYVEEGEKVKAGQLLLDLDTSIKDVDITTYEKLLSDTRLEKEVLESIINNVIYNNLLEKYEASENKEFLIKYYNAVVSNSNARLDVLNSQLEQSKVNLKLAEDEVGRIEKNKEYVESSIATLKTIMEADSVKEEQLNLINTKLEALEEDEKRLKALYDQGVISYNDWKEKNDEVKMAEAEYNVQKKNIIEEENENNDKLNQLENQLDNYNKSIEIQMSNIELAKVQVSEIENNISNFNTEEKKNLLNQLVEKETQIITYEAEIEKGQKKLDYNHLYAPVDGEVYGLTVNTIGAVAKPAESIMTIVPEGTELIIEASLMNKDIGYIEMGQEVIVKVDTFPFQKFGTIDGEVIGISPNAYFDEYNGYVYKIKVRLNATELEANNKVYSIVSGMEVTAEIKTGQRRIIDFFLETLVKYIDESIKLR